MMKNKPDYKGELVIPCRWDRCRELIREPVQHGYSLAKILYMNGWTAAPDGIGFYCREHSRKRHI